MQIASRDAICGFYKSMSKLYEKYEKLKSEEIDYIYLFLCGNFYIALDRV